MAPADPVEPGVLLDVDSLTVTVGSSNAPVRLVEEISFTVSRGETVVVVGESGSGKTVTSRAVTGWLPGPGLTISGTSRFDGIDLVTADGPTWRSVLGPRIGIVGQDPSGAFNPVRTIGAQIDETLRVRGGRSRREARAESIGLLEAVGLPDPAVRHGAHPHQLSGGMRQRAALALALALSPELLIADEPSSALDVTVQAQVVELLRDHVVRRDMALLFITHDLGLAAQLADRVVVMYAGRIVEDASALDLYRAPLHPYTGALLSLAGAGRVSGPGPLPLAGAAPDPSNRPGGCDFAPRCPRVAEICVTDTPTLVTIDLPNGAGTDHRRNPSRRVACHRTTEPV